MDRVVAETDHAHIVRQIITEYADMLPSYSDVQAEKIFDEEHGHYMLFYTGWDGNRRVHGSVIHVTLCGGKVWVQHDGTEEGIVDELINAGVSPDKIVLGFHHPNERKFTEFAVA